MFLNVGVETDIRYDTKAILSRRPGRLEGRARAHGGERVRVRRARALRREGPRRRAAVVRPDLLAAELSTGKWKS